MVNESWRPHVNARGAEARAFVLATMPRAVFVASPDLNGSWVLDRKTVERVYTRASAAARQ